MNKAILILRHELITLLSRPTYLLFAFGLPVVGVLIFSGFAVLNARAGDDQVSVQEESFELDVEGYVDHSGLIKMLPEDIPPGHLVAYPSEDDAGKALESGEISAYYVVQADYLETGDLVYVHPTHNPITPQGQPWVMQWTLLVNLLEGDIERASTVWNPMQVRVTDVASQASPGSPEGDCATLGYSCDSHILLRILPLIMTILFFVSIVSGASLLLSNVSKEKENRMLEILMVSVSPQQMLAGKIIGLGVLGLLQIATWIGAGFLILRMGGSTLDLPETFRLPVSVLVWGLMLYLLGYAVYASLMAGLGALVPSLKAASQVSGLVMLPLIISYFILIMPPAQEAPHGALVTGLSLFPLTAPVAMMLRLTAGGVPAYQLVLAIGLLLLTAVLTVRAVARMFRAQTLLVGQPFTVKGYLNALLGRG